MRKLFSLVILFLIGCSNTNLIEANQYENISIDQLAKNAEISAKDSEIHNKRVFSKEGDVYIITSPNGIFKFFSKSKTKTCVKLSDGQTVFGKEVLNECKREFALFGGKRGKK